MKKSFFILCLAFLSACSGGGGSSTSQCPPFKTVGGENYNAKLCANNQKVEEYCKLQNNPCEGSCDSLVGAGLSGVVLSGRYNTCVAECRSKKAACLYENHYVDGVCGQSIEIHNLDCITTMNNSTTGSTTTGGTTTGGTTTGGTTTGGTTTGGTTTGSTTTGGTTTGGTTTGGTTTGGTTTGGTTTGGTTTGGTTGSSTGTWGALSTVSAPSARRSQTAIWTGTEMIVWGGSENYVYQGNIQNRNTNTGGKYNSSTNSWIGLQNQPGTPTTRDMHTAVWTGSEMIIWGGYQDSQQTNFGWANAGPTNTGSSYNPSTNSWNPTTITEGPSERYGHTAIWTGTNMIIWGGAIFGSNSFTNSGSSYHPSTFNWTALPNPNSSTAPSARWQHTAIWTGTEMIVWGGAIDSGSTSTNTGGRFNPSTNTWTALSTDGAPSARYGHTAIWTGSEMIIWGGNGRTGGRYDPSTNVWSALSVEESPVGRGHTAIWNGREMIVWGGKEVINGILTYSNSGGSYNPVTNLWAPIQSSGASSARAGHSAVWDGAKMIIWGGGDIGSNSFVNTGGRLIP